MILSNAAIRNRTTIFVLILLIVLTGISSYFTLPRENFPEINIPIINIVTTNPGVAPSDIVDTITNEIEQKLSGLNGVKQIVSESSEGLSVITIEFLPSENIEEALQRVKDKVDLAKPELPKNTDEPVEPVVSEVNVSEFPIINISLAGPISPVRLKGIAETLEEYLEGITGVLEVNITGMLEREIVIEVDPDLMTHYGLTIEELINRIPSANVNQTAGGLETEGVKFNIRIPAEFQKPEEIDKLPLTTRGGKTIYLTDIATIRDTSKDRTTYSRLNGNPCISLSVKKRVGANIIEITDHIKAVVAEFRKQCPQSVEFAITQDKSKEIRNSIIDLENNIMTGLLLVIAVLVVFMGLRSSLIVAMAIPLSMLLSFSILLLLGMTLNMVVLFSLILALGMLVDNAIVIVENIYRFMEKGYPRVEAAMKGTAEVAWPVIASTATTVAAFFPLIFWPGIIGEFMQYLPITVIVVLSSSLFVAMIINPVICSVFAKPKHKKVEKTTQSAFIHGYRRLLGFVLKHPGVTVCLAAILLGITLTVFIKRGAGSVLFPKMDPPEVLVSLRGMPGTHIDHTDGIVRKLEKRIEQIRKNSAGFNNFDDVIANSGYGGGDGGFLSSSGKAPHRATIAVIFPDYNERKITSRSIMPQIRQATKDIPGVEIRVVEREEGPPVGAAVSIEIAGKDMKQLEQISNKVMGLIRDVPNLVNLRTNLEMAKPEMIFVPDRKRIARLGITTATISNYLKTAIFGTKVGVYRQFNDEYDIRLRVPITNRDSIEDIERLRIPNRKGEGVPIGSLGKFKYVRGLGAIHRLNKEQVVTITGDAEGRSDKAVLADVMNRLDPLGAASFTTLDVLDWEKLAKIMQGKAPSPAEEVSKELYDRLGYWDSGKVDRVADNTQQLKNSDDDRKLLLKLLNETTGGKSLYNQSAFANIQLDEQATKLLQRKDSGDKLTAKETKRLNRLLLEGAFPKTFATRERFKTPDGYKIKFAGKNEDEKEASEFLSKAFLIALLLIVAILVTQFNTLTVPLIIMTTIILSLIGVFLGLIVFDLPFGIIMTGVGMISLAGVVVNNAIVLLDYTRLLQRRGHNLVDAAIEAGITRLRPVLLTAGTTILSLIPMATGVSFDFHTMSMAPPSESNQWWGSMAITVIFGLAVATLLTLLVVPSLYVMLYRLTAKFGLGGLKKIDTEKDAPVLEDF